MTAQPSLLPSGHTAVMASRAPSIDGLDYFPTPPWAARAGAEIIARVDPGTWKVWEPACGGGHMAHGLTDYFGEPFATDVHDYGWPGCRIRDLDFLSAEADELTEFDWIITNPPFVMGDEFVRAAWRRARRGVAMLLRLVFLEGGKRYRLLYEDCPLSIVAPFSERVPMVKGRWDPEASSATAYAWFIWIKPDAGLPQPAHPILLPIPPGQRTALSREGDVAAFNGLADAPLFGGAAA
ncbi:hypothetical protein [Phenylobacterium sp.]|uniref:hypothetical protein n=1 Tax=Phenylobacterium sp. TaxID=1871053 RepID=UPI002737963B|nr:hypothetical protein [Phenylobacterium sp.]MDP3869161.1 hypothetical protein [Phenylobacterium sp.]